MLRITLLCLTFILTQAFPLNQQHDFSSALAPSPLPSPLPSPSITPSPHPSATADDTLPSDVLPTSAPLGGTDTTPGSPTPTPSDVLVDLGTGDNPLDNGGSTNEDDGYAYDDGIPNPTTQPDTEQQSDDPVFKSADSSIASPASISALALVGIAVGILAPAVLIYWFIRRRSQTTVVGFENMPEAEENTYIGRPRDTFTVA